MNAFKPDYQRAILANAKAFARSLKDQGLMVEGTLVSDIRRHTRLSSGWVWERAADGRTPRGEYIIVNYQSAPDDEAFTTAVA